MFSFEEIPDPEIRDAGQAARNVVLTVQILSNHICYTASFCRTKQSVPNAVADDLGRIGELNVQRLADRCHVLRKSIAKIAFDLCRALSVPKRIDGQDCSSVHHGVLERGESLLIRIMVLTGWSGVVDRSKPDMQLIVDELPIAANWLSICNAMADDESVQSADQFTVTALHRIVDEAVAAADKRLSSTSKTEKVKRPARPWRPQSKAAKAIVRCLEEGMTDADAICERTGASADNVHKVKSRWEKARSQTRES